MSSMNITSGPSLPIIYYNLLDGVSVFDKKIVNSVRRLLASKGISKLAGAAQDLTLFLIIMNYVSCTSHVHPLLVNLLIQIECIVFAFNRDLSYIGDSCSVLSIIGTVILWHFEHIQYYTRTIWYYTVLNSIIDIVLVYTV